jgi:hypothetical protein
LAANLKTCYQCSCADKFRKASESNCCCVHGIDVGTTAINVKKIIAQFIAYRPTLS